MQENFFSSSSLMLFLKGRMLALVNTLKTCKLSYNPNSSSLQFNEIPFSTMDAALVVIFKLARKNCQTNTPAYLQLVPALVAKKVFVKFQPLEMSFNFFICL